MSTIAEYEALMPHTYCCIHSMRIEWYPKKGLMTIGNPLQDGCPCYAHAIEFVFVEPGNLGQALFIRFEGVRQIILPHTYENELEMISSMKIEDIKHFQWDGVRYRVEGSDLGVIRFLCNDFDCELITIEDQES